MRLSRTVLIGALLITATATTVAAAAGQSSALPSGGAGGQRAVPVIDDGDRMVLPGNVPPLARTELDLGRSDPNLPMERMILLLELRPAAGARLEQLLAEQQRPGSPLYHQWLTPEEFGAEFGLADDDVRLVTGWLEAHGFTVEEVAGGRGSINFSGTAAQVEEAFATEMHDYLVEGTIHHSNATEPSLPRGFAGLVHGVVSLNSFPLRPLHTDVRAISAPEYTFAGLHFIAPADFATIYDLAATRSAGTNGNGQTIAIVARTDIMVADVQAFRSSFGLPPNDPVLVHNGADPGDRGGGDEFESILDTEWAGAVAPQATINLVVSASTRSSDGVGLSAQYVVSHNLAPIVSVSYGLCESKLGTSGQRFYNNLWAQAAAQGITALVASGDSGAAGCDAPSGKRGFGLAVNGLCSTPFDVCVGGTKFNDTANPNAFWTAFNLPGTRASALSYIPEVAWNESATVPAGSGLWSSGGGASKVYAKPSWQSGPGVPADRKRDVPDVALSAAAHDGYVIVHGTNLYAIAGTSAAAPAFAGLMALVDQAKGSRQGNVNPILYQLAANQYGAGGPQVFHDITAGNNSVPRLKGFACGPGYDEVTGLGSVDGAALIANWP
ncbi:MAG TPA: S53 family peptidase [Thermoanaerobaculia bacterium]|nr:S53 family peptidase [Thermoanaerobaculia bacterium]